MKFSLVRKFLRVSCILMVFLFGCGSQQSGNNAGVAKRPAKDVVHVVFTYGSEKQKWIDDVTATFNRANKTNAKGKFVEVEAIPMGSGECIDELISGRRKADITSPASAAFITLGNAESRAKTGKDLVDNPENLVLSPVVIAMWKPMAETIGWGKKPIGWAEILALAKNPDGWASHGHPEWGKFKFGHTHPEFSNSGLISLLAEVYAGAGKVSALQPSDLQNASTARYVNDIEQSIVHYGSSTGFFGRKMFDNGPEYLSAAVLYENMVIESYSQQNIALPVVAIYPKEGTFWSDHPAGIVNREWVTDEHREAAKIYLKYLLEPSQQQKAMTYGFRPAAVDISLTSPIDVAHGVDPHEPKTTLEVPSAEVMNSVIQLWHQQKKHADVILVFDTSGSMKDENKIANARLGSLQLVSMLDDTDFFSLLPFSSRPNWAFKHVLMKDGRDSSTSTLQGLFPSGGTALYDSIDQAYQYMLQNQQPDRISAVVVLTDGDDRDSHLSLQQLLHRIHFDSEHNSVRIFTIGYGSDAQKDVLKSIADATQAKFYEGTPDNIRSVFQDISTFF